MLNFYLSLLSDQADRERMTQIYQMYRQRMYLASYSVVKNEADAEDIVHEVFLKLADNMDKFGEADDPRTRAYIFSIVRNLSVSYTRRYKVEQRLFVSPDKDADTAHMISQIPSDEPPLIHKIQAEVRDEALREALQKLTPNQREILYLYHFQNRSVNDISESLGISSAAAYGRIKNAREALKKLLEESGYNAEDI